MPANKTRCVLKYSERVTLRKAKGLSIYRETKILREVYPEVLNKEILRFAQNDKMIVKYLVPGV
jgi:hypothetical protein